MRYWIHAAAVVLSLCMITSCQRAQRVQAGSEDRTADQIAPDEPIRGQLYSVDVAGKNMVIRVENGMAQTFKWDDATAIEGNLPDSVFTSPKTTSRTMVIMKELARHSGDIAVRWKDFNDEKMATVITVHTLRAPFKKLRRKRSAAR